jgi:3-dehydroquinate synthase
VAAHREILSSVGLPTSYGKAPFEELLTLMSRDKKARGGALRFVLLHDVAQPEILANPDQETLHTCYTAISGINPA